MANLLGVLSATSPDEPVWNWFDGKAAPARFWHRRAAHETAVHRWDAQFAVGIPEPLEPALAVDGIDEYLDFVAVGLTHRPVAGLSGSLHLHALDTGSEWTLVLAPNQLRKEGSQMKAATSIGGSASDLLLWLLNRCLDLSVLELHGERRIIDSWRAVAF